MKKTGIKKRGPLAPFFFANISRAANALKNLWRFARVVARRFVDDRCTRVAGALAFTAVLALVPLMAVSFAMFSIFPVFQTWMVSAQEFIYTNFVPAAGDVAVQYLEQFSANAGKLTVWGLVFLFVTALTLMLTIEDAFNDIWHVSGKRRWTHRFVAHWVVLTLGPLLVGLSLSITSYLLALSSFSPTGATHSTSLFLLPVFFECVMFVLLYMVVPNCTVRMRHALVGAGFATVLFEITKRAFGAYVSSLSTYRAIYGAVATLPVFLIWIYLSWVVTLLGAEVTAALSDSYAASLLVKKTKSGTENARTRT